MFLGLRSQHTLSFVTVTFAFAVFLVGILHGDVFVHEVLAVHVRDGVVGGFEVGVGDESIAFREAGFISRDLGRRDQGAETREGVVEGFFVDKRVEVADEQLGAHFDCFLLVCRGLVYTVY